MNNIPLLQLLVAFATFMALVSIAAVAAVWRFHVNLQDQFENLRDQHRHRYQDLHERVTRTETHIDHIDNSPPSSS